MTYLTIIIAAQSVVIAYLLFNNYWQRKLNSEILESLELIKKISEQQDIFNDSQLEYNTKILSRFNKIDSENVWLFDKLKLLYGNNVG